MQEEKVSYSEAKRRFGVVRSRIPAWERIYLTEGPEGLAIERRGRGSTGRPKKLPKEVEKDLLAEVLRLRAENAYLKNLQALVLENERRRQKNAGDSKTEAGISSGYLAGDRSIAPGNLLLSFESDGLPGQI